MLDLHALILLNEQHLADIQRECAAARLVAQLGEAPPLWRRIPRLRYAPLRVSIHVPLFRFVAPTALEGPSQLAPRQRPA